MKWKSRKSGVLFSTSELRLVTQNVVNWQDSFQPIYEVGDVVITEGCSDKYDGKPLTIEEINGRIFHFEEAEYPEYSFTYTDIKRLVTPEEVEKAKNKLPFTYIAKGLITHHIVKSCGWDDQVFIGRPDNLNGTYLTIEAWQKIGKAMRWNNE